MNQETGPYIVPRKKGTSLTLLLFAVDLDLARKLQPSCCLLKFFLAVPDVALRVSQIIGGLLSALAAETTQAAGGTYFQIVSAADASRASTFVAPGSSTTTFVGNQAFTNTSPGSVDTVIRPGQDVYIRVLKLPAGAPAQGVYSAAEIVQFTGARVQRPS